MIKDKLSFLWNEYIEYKGVKLYPFLLEDYDIFEEVIDILLFDKNAISNVDIIKMSYLKFILFVVPHISEQHPDVAIKLDKLLGYVLKEQDFKFVMDEKEKIFINVGNKVILNEFDFDKIKNIILKQNAMPVIDDKLHPDLRRELQENMAFLSKLQGNKDGTIEDQVVSYKCEMKYVSYEDIKKMTIYQFRKELLRLNLIKEYLIYKTAECSGMVKFNSPIPHWTSHINNKPDYSGLLMNKREFDSKLDRFSTNRNN